MCVYVLYIIYIYMNDHYYWLAKPWGMIVQSQGDIKDCGKPERPRGRAWGDVKSWLKLKLEGVKGNPW